MNDWKVIEKKSCKHCNSSFEITDKDLEFYEKISPKFNWEKCSIPTPTLCPDCRQQRRLSWRNERKLYKRKCDLTWKGIISTYSPDKLYKVYETKEWRGDKWNVMNYWRDFDFNKSFFEQYSELFMEVPKISLSVLDCENSEFNNDISYSKRAYLCFDSSNIVDSSYISASKNITNSCDVWWCDAIQESYDIISSDNIYNCSFIYWCYHLKNCFLCKECYNCDDCIMCYWLRNKKYCIENKQYTQEEYSILKKRYFQGKNSILLEAKKTFQDLCIKLPARNIYTYNTANSSGNNIYNSNNCHNCFDVASVDNWSYVYNSWFIKNVFDCSYVYEWDWMILDSTSLSSCTGIFFSDFLTNCSSCFYCSYSIWCSDCFWCIWLRNAQYCILNKQYTKEQYNELVPRIIEHMTSPQLSPLKGEGVISIEWWEFFPAIISPFWYNETLAQDYYPLKKEEVLNSGFKWSDYEQPFPKVEKIIPANMLPDNLDDIPDDILNWAIECEISKKPFKIMPQELMFYRKHNLPVPRRHPDQRHLDRMILRNPRKLHNRKCDKCSTEIKTVYSPDRKEVVYCENCFNKENY